METSARCFQCHGPYHPATGDYDKAWDIAFCETCIRPFYKWLKGHMKRPWGGRMFYQDAASSIVAGRRNRPLVHDHEGCTSEGEMLRAGGDVRCDICGNVYYTHPLCRAQLDWDGNPYLNVACDGRHLHL